MRQHNNKNNNNNNNRSRGRGGRKGPNPLTRSYESNGPDVKVRGTAQHVAEKYQTLARDSLSAGDGISAEAYFQYAEHYNRIIMTAQAQQNAAREEERRNAPQPQVNHEQAAADASPVADAAAGDQTPSFAGPVTGDEPQPIAADYAGDSQSDEKAPDEEQPKPRRKRAPNRKPRRADASADGPAVSDESRPKKKSDTILENPPAFLMTD